MKSRIRFSDTVVVHDTYQKSQYDRGAGSEPVMKYMLPSVRTRIRDELNEYKMFEMLIHQESVLNTALY